MPLLVHTVRGALAVHGKAVQLPGKPHGKVADVDDFLHLAQTLLQALAHFVAHQLAQSLLMLPEPFAHLPDDLAPQRRGFHPPGFEGGLGGFYHSVVVFSCGFPGGGNAFAIDRGKRFQRFAFAFPRL